MSRKDVIDDVLRALSTTEHKQSIDIRQLAKETQRDPRTIRGYLDLLNEISNGGVLVVKCNAGKDDIYMVCHFPPLKANIEISNVQLLSFSE